MSQLQNCGPADLGRNGIDSFFERHRCGQVCGRDWMKPAIVGRAVHPMQQGTSMVARPPTGKSHDFPSRLQEYL